MLELKFRHRRLPALLCGLAVAAWLPPADAQPQVYPFAVEQDALAGPFDFSSMNRPLGAADRIFVREGHFFRVGSDLRQHTGDDQRVRFFGVNLCFGANFPEAKDAERIAARLARLGINLVRLHHMDSQPDRTAENAGSLLLNAPYPTLNPVAAGRLRGLLAALSLHGIYVNLNLHVGYTFQPVQDGLPPWPVNSVFPTQSKPLHIFQPRMVELQEQFARQVIEILELRRDPVLAMVEINNESSLAYAWQSGSLEPVLVGDYKTALQTQWNDFLKSRYETTGALRRAWGDGQPEGPDLLGGRPWQLEVHSPAQASLEVLMLEGRSTAKVTLRQAGAVVILKLVGFSMEAGPGYEAEVEMRADLPAGSSSAAVYWDVKQDVSPWQTQTSRNITLTSQWQKFRMTFNPPFAMNGMGRFGLSVEKAGPVIYARSGLLRRAGTRGLAAGESLEAANIALVLSEEAPVAPRLDDYLRFMADQDRSYLNRIAAVVRSSVDAAVPVAGTQVGYGGVINLDSHRDLDYQDNHFYIDHYNFPNTSWDGRDWRIRNSSTLGAGLSAFLNMAATREWGKPFTVSEYNQPWPNTRGGEIDPTLAVFGAFQDWDGILHFAYSHGRGWDDGVPSGFNLNGDWTKWPAFGQSAWLFRQAIVPEARARREIPLSENDRLRATREKRNGSVGGFLTALIGYDPNAALTQQVGLIRQAAGAASAEAAVPAPGAGGDSGDWRYDAAAQQFSFRATRAAGFFGLLGSAKVSVGPLAMENPPGAMQSLALLLTSGDGQPLTESRQLLLSNPGPSWRSQPGVQPARPQALVNYLQTTDWWTLEKEPAYASKLSGNLNGGQQPTWMERREVYLTLATAAAQISLFPLDGAGRRLKPLPESDVARTAEGFRIHLQAEGQDWSPWYEITLKYTRRK